MRFKATLADPKTLLKVANALEKVSKSITIKLTPRAIRFVAQDSTAVAGSGVQVWCNVAGDAAFCKCVIEARKSNEINAERALKSAVGAYDVSVWLTK